MPKGFMVFNITTPAAKPDDDLDISDGTPVRDEFEPELSEQVPYHLHPHPHHHI